MILACSRLALALSLGIAVSAHAEAVVKPITDQQPVANPERLVLYFPSGGTTIRAQDAALLDQASRLYRDGKPIVMIVSGATDTVGSPETNLVISQRRALAVLHGLLARGIPADRFQVLAKGETEPAVPTANGVAEARNRRVEISWR